MIASQIDSVWIDPASGNFHMIDWKRCQGSLDPSEGARFGRRGLPPCHFLLDNKFSHYAVQQNLYAAILRQQDMPKVEAIVVGGSASDRRRSRLINSDVHM
jgi:hypothetical protein